MGKTSIEWTRGDDGTAGKTWNPVRGCSRVSPGCEHCYAERIAGRFAGPLVPYVDPPLSNLALKTFPFQGFVRLANGHPQWTGKVELVEGHLLDPLHWRKAVRCFANSMSDLFHENLPFEDIDRVFTVIGMCDGVTTWERFRNRIVPAHTMQILSKRDCRMAAYCESRSKEWAESHFVDMPGFSIAANWTRRGIERSWLGVSVENYGAKHRIDSLREVPAAVRFLSIEPLLEDVGHLNLSRIGWVIAGAESGPGARPCQNDWVRNIRNQCVAAGVPFFYKQAAKNGKKIPLPVLDGQQWNQFPEVAAR